MIGRVREIATVRDALAHGRVVTLVGPGGVGKSAIARAAAGDRSTWVPLADGDTTDLDATLARAEAQAVVVLDDADLVLDRLPPLLARASGPVLVTSREPLRIEGERIIEVGPLPIEDGVALYCR